MKIFIILAHFLVIVVAFLNTHLWSVKRTIGFTLQLVLRAMAEEKIPSRAGKFAEHFSSSFQSPSLAAG